MTNRTTQLGAPGPRPLGRAANGQAAPGAGPVASPASMTLGTLREVRGELASLGALLERMSGEMKGLREAVEAVAAQGRQPAPETRAAGKADEKAVKRARKAEAAREARDADLAARVEKLERQVKRLKRRADWLA